MLIKRLAIATLLALVACGPKAAPITELTPAQLYERGVAEFEEGDWVEAVRYLDRFVLVGGADPRVNQARYWVAEANFNRRQYVTAAAEFARLASDLGRGDLADDARFMACRAYEELSPKPQLDQEYTRAAIDHCRALLEFFPETEYAERSNQIIARMRGKLGAKLFESADWYFDHRAYDSAIIYFEDVVRLFPDTEWAPKALRRLMDIYAPERLDYAEEREEARQRLLQGYPTSPEAREVRG